MLALDSGQAPGAKDAMPSTQDFLSALTDARHTFLQPTPSLHSAALQLAKTYLDPLASSISATHRDRRQQTRLKRKRGASSAAVVVDNAKILGFDKLYVDGFDVEQVWGQARMVLDAAKEELRRDKSALSLISTPKNKPLNGVTRETDRSSQAKNGTNGYSSSESEEDAREGEDELLDDNAKAASTDHGSEAESSDDPSDSDTEKGDFEEGLSDDAGTNEDQDAGDIDREEPQDELVQDAFGLNDGFFSIDAFNKQTTIFERQDAAGDAVDLGDDDEDEIDWHADPMSAMTDLHRRSKAHKKVKTDDDDDDEGPTFDDGPSDPEEKDYDMDGGDDMGAGENTNDIRYEQFFAPPARKSETGVRRPSKASRKTKSSSLRGEQFGKQRGDEDDVQRTIDAVRRDLFEDDFSGPEDESDHGASRADAAGRKRASQSTHERRKARLAEEIRRLEAANVAKKEWTLAGEARAGDRPINSLLEEDLEFERVGKPVPVITAEVSESIEDLIKRRIIAQEFDELVRRRPDEVLAPSEVRRGRFELDDNKAQQSLAQIYEEEHLKRADPEGQASRQNEKDRKEYAEIEALWANVSNKLDALSNWHYRPKPAIPALHIVADVPTVTMEDARPTATVGSAGNLERKSMLAPQEVYKPGQKGRAGIGSDEIVPKSGLPVATEEMTREEKLRRRRRHKERLRKSLATKAGGAPREQTTGTTDAIASNGKQKQRRDKEAVIVNTLKRANVRVIGRKGELTDIQGRQVTDDARARPKVAAAGFKL
jgi:U3 small nucleolar RNA-associated protein MPP10